MLLIDDHTTFGLKQLITDAASFFATNLDKSYLQKNCTFLDRLLKPIYLVATNYVVVFPSSSVGVVITLA